MAGPARYLTPESTPLRLGRALEGPPRRRPPYALFWAITLSFMLVMCVSSWVFSLYVFGHPEEPIPYKILQKLHRLEPPKRFDVYAVPKGSALPARDGYAKYRRFLSLPPAEMAAMNARLLREYVSNYRRADPADYISGTFRILKVVPLHSASFLPQGLAVRAISTEIEDLEIEYLMPGPAADLGHLQAGDALILEANHAFAAVVQFSPMDDQRLCLSLIPLVYGPHTPPNGDRIDLEPPAFTTPDAPWPQSDFPPP